MICAGIVPIFIIPSEHGDHKVSLAIANSITVFQNLTGAWALSVFGFISAAMLPFPFLLYKFGPTLRAMSPYNKSGGMTTVEMQAMGKVEAGPWRDSDA